MLLKCLKAGQWDTIRLVWHKLGNVWEKDVHLLEWPIKTLAFFLLFFSNCPFVLNGTVLSFCQEQYSAVSEMKQCLHFQCKINDVLGNETHFFTIKFSLTKGTFRSKRYPVLSLNNSCYSLYRKMFFSTMSVSEIKQEKLYGPFWYLYFCIVAISRYSS